jgi:uncharacterized protein
MSRIAVIGAGISGLAVAYFLSRKHEVWLFEKEPRLGGHTHTHSIETPSGTLHVDTGFIVHNDRTYPNFIRLMRELCVERQKSDMSFGVTDRASGLEYSSRGLNGLFALRANFFRPQHYALLREILRFNKTAADFLDIPGTPNVTLRKYIRDQKFSERFTRYYLYPMAGAVWSTSPDEIGNFPAFTLIRFFHNHGFLGYYGQPTWYTLQGGSSQYIRPIIQPYQDRIATAIQITGVSRTAKGISVTFTDQPVRTFDEVVLACHAPQALALLQDASPLEASVLAKFATTTNHTVLHTDSSLLPRRPAARAAWNYLLGAKEISGVTVTYHMNRLQNIRSDEDYCVTLNATEAINPQRILREMKYNHPLYNLEAIRAQTRWAEISGQNHTHFCGAYWSYGFHEDGLNSALRVAQALGVDW